MKKYILTALLGVFGLFGAFASADSKVITSVSNVYSPSSITLGSSYKFTSSDFTNFVCDSDPCYILLYTDSIYNGCSIYSDGDSVDISDSYDSCSFNEGLVNIGELASSDKKFNSITLNYPGVSGGSGDTGTSSGIISGGSTMFGNIINSVSSTIGEFIPYVVQVGVGIISAIIGFVAIKRLMNRIRAKVLSTFNSRKRR